MRDGLSIIMQNARHKRVVSQKRERSLSCGFVLCPVGCGKTINEKLINVHIDQCISEKTKKRKCIQGNALVHKSEDELIVQSSLSPPIGSLDQKPARVSLAAGNFYQRRRLSDSQDDCTAAMEDCKCFAVEPNEYVFSQPEKTINHQLESKVSRDKSVSTENQRIKSASPVQVNACSETKMTEDIQNIFSHMMERSKCLSSSGDTMTSGTASFSVTVQQCLYLTTDGSVLLFDNSSSPPPHLPVIWSAVVVLKDRYLPLRTTQAQPATGTKTRIVSPRHTIELTVSTGVPPAPEPSVDSNWVRLHSRLSVPVLKSILQKSIRRRMPLPSVRVAMELADKSLGDLLRRLPVIILEDSTLHPDLPFLLWLMMANSKDYHVPQFLMTRLFQVIFQVASCQWKDDASVVERQDTEASDTTTDICLSLHQLLRPKALLLQPWPMSQVLVWSMLVRSEYGGMKCDVEMLHRFARLWNDRFRSLVVPTESVLSLRISIAKGQNCLSFDKMTWTDILTRLHERSRIQSIERVTPLCVARIQKLQLNDVSIEGVDFHCSHIIDHLLSVPSMPRLCADLLILDPDERRAASFFGHSSDLADGERRSSKLKEIFQYCLWHYSSGINRRRAFIERPLEGIGDYGSDTNGRIRKYEELWNQLIANEAIKYQMSFVRDRLARS